MFKTLLEKLPRDRAYPERQFRIDALTRVLRGTLYDHLPHDFHTEYTGLHEYIPLRERRPCVRAGTGICKTVVDHSVSLLFAEGQFPQIDCEDERTRNALRSLIKETQLNEVMIEAATLGAVGSVAILLRVLKSRVFFAVMHPQFLTPVWRADAPDTLERVIEQYKVSGRALQDKGYAIDEPEADYWFRREWTCEEEIWLLPWKVHDDTAQPRIDAQRTTPHHLSFVPLVWIKNLPNGEGVDGACTFEAAIDTCIEMDYQLSQAGRGLKYSSDPQLFIKDPDSSSERGEQIKGAANALVGRSEHSDAKLLEINGNAAAAVVDYVRCLRELALESIHGNRAHADKLNATQSGRAMELLNQPLIWLADKLRISYGEGALLSLLKMVIAASQCYPLVIAGEPIGALNPKAKLSLRWPRWYAPSAQDRQQDAHTLKTLTEAGLLSRETATHILSGDWDIGDVSAERQRIEAERPGIQAQQQPIGVAMQTP